MKRVIAAALFVLAACARPHPVEVARPSILLVTLDTTRADAIRPDTTPNFNALAARGLLFRQAYTPVPQTLAAHASIMTGLYPAGHGVHENGRYLSEKVPLLAEQMKSAGYRTAAFVSAFALARRFGLGRGFDIYDDQMPEPEEERSSKETTDRALAYLARPSAQPLFLWVHYYDPHFPYTPPEPYRSRYRDNLYLGEVAAMDEQLARLVAGFRGAIIIAGDHGEGLGEHGETQHGNLLYQATVHVPLLVIGPGVRAGGTDTPVSTRRIFHTIRDWAGLEATHTLRRDEHEVVVAEAMKPFLDYGWQPQVMALDGRFKTISDGKIAVYDVMRDPEETHDLAGKVDIARGSRAALHDYPIPSPETPAPSATTEEERRKLASLGYVSATTKPVIRKDAPRPVDMARLFPLLDQAAHLFVLERYREAIPLLERILRADPYNLDAALRLATCYSSLGREQQALVAFKNAEAIAPNSQDVRTYLALHYGRGKDWQKAIPLLEGVIAEAPDRLPALEALAVLRERQGRIEDAVRLGEKIYAMRDPTPAELVRLGGMEMSLGQTDAAIRTLEKARAQQGSAFQHDLELGVLYLASHRLDEAKAALDRVPPSSPGFPMALFKRAQVSVLLREADAASRIEEARRHSDPTTRELIEREKLFR